MMWMLPSSGPQTLQFLANYRESQYFPFERSSIIWSYSPKIALKCRCIQAPTLSLLAFIQFSALLEHLLTTHPLPKISNICLHTLCYAQAFSRSRVSRQSSRLHRHPAHTHPTGKPTDRPGHQRQRPSRRRRLQQRRRRPLSRKARPHARRRNLIPRPHLADLRNQGLGSFRAGMNMMKTMEIMNTVIQ